MKKSILLLFAAVIFLSCENTETNSTAMQANLNANFFRAYSVSAEADNETQMISIVGTSDHEEFTLHTKWKGARNYNITQNSANYATFTDARGKVYTTRSAGSSGRIKIKTEDKENQQLTGEFNFTFMSATDTITVSRGVFYTVPYEISDIVVD
tara:strand:- start:13 stop:474 length:462 start_codon:yes stop_codon:yes gene_type:complete